MIASVHLSLLVLEAGLVLSNKVGGVASSDLHLDILVRLALLFDVKTGLGVVAVAVLVALVVAVVLPALGLLQLGLVVSSDSVVALLAWVVLAKVGLLAWLTAIATFVTHIAISAFIEVAHVDSGFLSEHPEVSVRIHFLLAIAVLVVDIHCFLQPLLVLNLGARIRIFVPLGIEPIGAFLDILLLDPVSTVDEFLVQHKQLLLLDRRELPV